MKEAVLFLEPKVALVDALGRVGLSFPSQVSQILCPPRDLLIRVETSNKVRDKKDYCFEPHSGQWSSFGVFFADCLESLPCSGDSLNDSVAFVYQRDKISTDWLIVGTDKWREKIFETGNKLGVNCSTTSGACEVDRKIYESYSTYNPRSGVATYPKSDLSIAFAEKVLAFSKAAASRVENFLPSGLRGNLITL